MQAKKDDLVKTNPTPKSRPNLDELIPKCISDPFQTCVTPWEGSLACIMALNETLQCPPKIKPFTPKTGGSFAFWTSYEFDYIKEMVRNFPSSYPNIVKLKFEFADNPDSEYCKMQYAELEEIYADAMSNLEKGQKLNEHGPWEAVDEAVAKTNSCQTEDDNVASCTDTLHPPHHQHQQEQDRSQKSKTCRRKRRTAWRPIDGNFFFNPSSRKAGQPSSNKFNK